MKKMIECPVCGLTYNGSIHEDHDARCSVKCEKKYQLRLAIHRLKLRTN